MNTPDGSAGGTVGHRTTDPGQAHNAAADTAALLTGVGGTADMSERFLVWGPSEPSQLAESVGGDSDARSE